MSRGERRTNDDVLRVELGRLLETERCAPPGPLGTSTALPADASPIPNVPRALDRSSLDVGLPDVAATDAHDGPQRAVRASGQAGRQGEAGYAEVEAWNDSRTVPVHGLA